MKKLLGTGVALVTPFDKEKKVDFSALRKLVEYTIREGVDYLVVMGTTAESPVISPEEKKEILRCVIETNQKRLPIVFGVGGNDTAKILKELKEVNTLEEVDAILSVTPYYNKPNQRALIEHFSAVAETSTKPIILYNVPGRTGINMQSETTIALAKKYSNIVAIKEASGNFEQIMSIINHKPDYFEVISGDDALTLPLIAIGAKGVISVVANAIPKIFSKMVRLALSGNIDEARQIHYQILEVAQLAFAEGSPSGIKCFLYELGIIQHQLRLPLVTVSDSLHKNIKAWIAANQQYIG